MFTRVKFKFAYWRNISNPTDKQTFMEVMSEMSTKFVNKTFNIPVMNVHTGRTINVWKYTFSKLNSRQSCHLFWLIILLSNFHSWESCNLHESRLALADHLGFVRKSILQSDCARCCVGLNSLTNGPGYRRLWWAQVVTVLQLTSFQIPAVNYQPAVMTSDA